MFVGSRAEATTWVVPEPQALASSADAVVLATVEQVQSVAQPDGSRIDTEITLVVHDGLKGAVAGDRIVLREVGGHVGSDQQWMFGSPEYRVGETALVHVKRDETGRLHTHQMALGKLDAEVESNGRVWLRRERRDRGTERLSLDSFVAGLPGGREIRTRARPRGGMTALARLTSAGAPLTGHAQAVREFRMMSPESRWFDGPLSVFGDLAADRTLGAAVSRRVEQAMVAAWDGQPGSALDVQLAGNRQGPGFVCNPGYVTVSWNDPAEQVGDPMSCGGGAIAVGGFCSSGSTYGGTGYQRITSGAVVVNDGWDSCWFWNEKNLEEVLTHELGHTLGLAHSWEAGMGSVNDSFITGATMYWMAHFDGRGARLADYDQGALAWLYPGATTPVPTPTPSPRPTATPRPTPAVKPTPTPAPVQDADIDGVRDIDDNCPADYNSAQGDADDDGVGDVCDSCAALANAPSVGCGTLEGYTRVAVRKTGKVLLDVRMRLPEGVEMRSASEVGVVIESESATWTLGATDSALRINGAGTVARLGTARSGLSLHATGGDSVALRLHSNDPAAKKLAGASSFVIDLNLGTQRAAARLQCQTTWPEGRQVTRCETD